jgi:hypothetical protein
MKCHCSFCQFIELGKIAKKENCEIGTVPVNDGFSVYKYPENIDFYKLDYKEKMKYLVCFMFRMKYCDKNIGE